MLVYKPRASALGVLFGQPKAVIGVIHSLPLPGSPHMTASRWARSIDFAAAEAAALRDGGVDGLIVENHGDIPSPSPTNSARKPPPAWR